MSLFVDLIEFGHAGKQVFCSIKWICRLKRQSFKLYFLPNKWQRWGTCWNMCWLLRNWAFLAFLPFPTEPTRWNDSESFTVAPTFSTHKIWTMAFPGIICTVPQMRLWLSICICGIWLVPFLHKGTCMMFHCSAAFCSRTSQLKNTQKISKEVSCAMGWKRFDWREWFSPLPITNSMLQASLQGVFIQNFCTASRVEQWGYDKADECQVGMYSCTFGTGCILRMSQEHAVAHVQ